MFHRKMFKLYQKVLKQQTNGVGRISSVIRCNTFASSTAIEVKNANTETLPVKDKSSESTRSKPEQNRNNLINAAFASIRTDSGNTDAIKTPFTDDKIKNANTIDELLSLSQGLGVSRQHALKVVSVLSTWTSIGKVRLSDFESDIRFIRLCKVLTKTISPSKARFVEDNSKSEDLSTILNITADEEAAKIVASITIPQMIKVLSTLSARRRRSPLLLRTIAYNITASQEKLDIKQCADLLYSISILNYYDENLFGKVANDITDILQKERITKSAVIGSILTSIGLMRYKSPVLDAISEWIVKNHTICRPQDIFSFFMTLGVVNYIPSNSETLYKLLIPQLTQEEAGNPVVWLDIVWSLVLLNHASVDHIQSVLNEEFIQNLESNDALSTSVKLKLLNIDGVAHYLIKDYSGPKIPSIHSIRTITLSLTKEKTEMVNSVIETMKNLISENNLKTWVNTGLGFYFVAECLLDKTCNPRPLTATGSDLTKIAVLAYDFHDMCKGKGGATGINDLSERLLSAMGYKIVSVCHTDFNIRDKVVNKVKYLETKLKEAVQS